MEKNVSDLLQKLLPPARLDLISQIASESLALGFPIYFVGGFVRDLLLGLPGQDFDLVVEGDAIALGERLVGRSGGKLTAHGKFMTAKWFLVDSMKSPDLSFLDLISARSEIYKHPAALPTVKRGDLSADLRRRDFSINAMAIRLDSGHFGELRDDLGGLEDLKVGRVRVLHPRSFVDDPTRMYRAVRYEQRYGFQVVPETLELFTEGRGLIDKLSAQRIRHEFDLILDEPKAASMLGRLAELDLLRPVHSALPWDDAFKQRLEAKRHPEMVGGREDRRYLNWLLWLSTLTSTKIDSLDRRLHFDAVLKKSLLAASRLFVEAASLDSLKPSQCVERLEGLPLLAVYAVYLAAESGSQGILGKFLVEWRHVKPKTTASELKKRGLMPGPKYQIILRQLRNAWLDGEVNSQAEEQTLVGKLI